MIPFETDNLRAYMLLLRIEIALRECLRNCLESEYGAHWRKRLPGELLKKIKQSQAEENRPQFDFLRLGPLYYLTFGELLTLLKQKPGCSVAGKLGGDCILKQLENIFTPRNSVCHSRPVSSVGLKTIETLYAEMETALTAAGFAQLIAKPDTGLAQDGRMTPLQDSTVLSSKLPLASSANTMPFRWVLGLRGHDRGSVSSVT